MAALANWVRFLACDRLLTITALVMAGVTQAHGGPLSKPASPVSPGVIAFAVAWWGLVTLGVTFPISPSSDSTNRFGRPGSPPPPAPASPCECQCAVHGVVFDPA